MLQRECVFAVEQQNQRTGKKLRYLLVIALFVISGCDSDWKKRKYCAQLGRVASEKIVAKAEKDFLDPIASSHNFEWNYCKALDTCLMDESEQHFVVREDTTKMLSDARYIRDLMTNKILYSLYKSGEEIKLTDQERFEGERDKKFPHCFTSKAD